MTGVWRLRAAVLTLVGMLVVHHGRYAFAGAEPEHEAAHTYLTWLAPASAVLLFLVVAQLAASLGRTSHEDRPSLPGVRTLWPAATATLLVVFGAQECLEALLAHGELPALGDGAWTAIPFALAAGGVVALLLRGAQEVVRWALRRARPTRRPVPVALVVPRAAVLAVPRSVLARCLAGRAPPGPSARF